MSAETIPTEVPTVGSVWVKKPNPVTVAASISTGVSYNFDGGSGEATLSRFLQEYEPADRSTRPAEPAPEVEVGDGEVERRWIGVVPSGLAGPAKLTMLERVAEIWRDQGLSVTEWVPRSTLEAERARADAAERERDEHERTIAALEAKVRSLSPHGVCACSYDEPGDLCMHHSPKLATAEADLSRALQDRDEAVRERDALRISHAAVAEDANEMDKALSMAWSVMGGARNLTLAEEIAALMRRNSASATAAQRQEGVIRSAFIAGRESIHGIDPTYHEAAWEAYRARLRADQPAGEGGEG